MLPIMHLRLIERGGKMKRFCTGLQVRCDFDSGAEREGYGESNTGLLNKQIAADLNA